MATNIPLFLWNTLSRTKEEFRPIKKTTASLYTCGPTVYNYAHLGNLRTYIFEDILERTLLWNGYKVKRVMNITDVGHLTGDTDDGEDKMEKGARESGKSVKEIASFYTKAFFTDLKKLNINKPKIIAPATAFIKEQIKLVETLEKRGYAYDTPEAVYFNTSKFPAYGRLAGQSLSEKRIGARSEVVQDPDKQNPTDFALWFKAVGKFENHILRWKSPWGVGFPGWHVECSAIARHFLGQPFDIHTGGVDHIGTHHTNEIAQSEAAYHSMLAMYWLHGEHLGIENSKMAKSSGNFFTIASVEEKKINPLAFRHLTFTAHYRTPLNFTWESLEQSEKALHNLYQKILFTAFLARTQKASRSAAIAEVRVSFTEAINNDLNMPQALALLQSTLQDKLLLNQYSQAILDFALTTDQVFGLNFSAILKEYNLPTLLRKNTKLRNLVKEREECRRNQQFVQSDALRKKISALGYQIEDTPYGQFVAPDFGMRKG